jgi:hypothetical protein
MTTVHTYFEDRTTDGESDPYTIADGGPQLIKITGTFDGATVKVLMDFADDDYVVLDSYTEEVGDLLKGTKSGCRLKVSIESAGASTSITAKSF